MKTKRMKVLLRTRRILPFIIVMLVGMLGLAADRLLVTHAAATTFTVTNCNNDSQLQSDVTTANTDNAGDTIIFSCSGDILLTSTLTITGSMSINGNGQSVTLDGQGSRQVILVNLNVLNVHLTLNALTIANGSASAGGGLENNPGGTVNITNSTFANNSASLFGGGLENFSGIVNITNSTFANNSATNFGGALDLDGGTVNITNSTFANNSASTFGVDPAGLSSAPGTLFITQSIVANNTPKNCVTAFGGIITDGGYNLSNDTSCGFTDPTSRQNINPGLNPAGRRPDSDHCSGA